jgi:hypothetical protein
MSTWIYFIENGEGLVKIGFTGRHPLERLRSLQTSSASSLKLVAAMPGSMADERALHGQFAHLRCAGEWFRADDELLEFIEDVGLPEIAASAGADPAHLVYVSQMRQWAESILAFVREREPSLTQAQAVAQLCAVSGLKPGFVENLRRGRIRTCDVHDLEAMRTARVLFAEQELAFLRSQLADFAPDQRTDIEDAFEDIEAALATAKALMRGQP